MDSLPKITGETLIVHHIPLVHCQVPGQQCCGQAGCANSFGPPVHLGLTRTTSLPERDVLHRESLLYSSLIQTSNSSGSSCAGGCGGGGKGGASGGRGGSLVSDSSSFTSNASEELSQLQIKSTSLRQNPFLLDAEDEEDANADDCDDLSCYLKDCSFHLHGSAHVNSVGSLPFQLHGSNYRQESLLGGPWCSDPGRVNMLKVASHLDSLHLSEPQSQQRHGSSGSTLSMDCGEQEWGEEGEEEGNFSQSAMTLQRCQCCSAAVIPGMHSDNQPGYASDSSCNSSDGVLVNFSAIYNRMNNAVPAKTLNLNTSTEQSYGSCASEPGGAFYLDLHASPSEPQDSNPAPCSCSSPPPVMDANCNSYHLPHDGLSLETSDLTSCLESRARLVLATQNYYKLVTCDLSSQSSPSPAGSSIASYTEEPSRTSPSQPTEYYLFRQSVQEGQGIKEELTQCHEEQDKAKQPSRSTIEGQVHVNMSPSVSSRVGQPRSRSYDQAMDAEQMSGTRHASLERMLSCPVYLSEGTVPISPQVPPHVTSFAEIARSKMTNGGGGSTLMKTSTEAFSAHSCSSEEASPILELSQLGKSQSLPPLPFSYCCSQAGCETSLHMRCHRHVRDSLGAADYGSCSKAEEDSSSEVVRYSKDQRPTTLPIQPFTLQQQFGKPQLKSLHPLLGDYAHRMYGKRIPNASRPAPSGSHSPVYKQGTPSTSSCSTCSPNSPKMPPCSLSCPLSGFLLPLPCTSSGHAHSSAATKPRTKQVPLPTTPPPPQSIISAVSVHCTPLSSLQTSALDPIRNVEPDHKYRSGDLARSTVLNCSGARLPNAHHLSPRALKWKEYRRKNPLCVETAATALSGRRNSRRAGSTFVRRNVFDFPASSSHADGQLNGQSLKQPQHRHSQFFPDFCCLMEKPPDEFCLSPDATSDSVPINLRQKKGLVKAVNIAVDLIVAHFGSSRDPSVKAKLGNSSVSPNVGHLLLKYLCPAIHDILQDGLRAYILDLIIGQRRNFTWNVVEASTQPGPSTRVLHSLFSKVSQYSELTSHSMRLNAFIFGLLNLQSLEFWFSYLYTHEDILEAHYDPWGFLLLSQNACQQLFEELLLLLQPLSLLPFDLDLLFEPNLLQKSQEHHRSKRQLCSMGHELNSSIQSTFQLMKGQRAESKCEGIGTDRGGHKKANMNVWKEEPWSMTEVVRSKKYGLGQKTESVRPSQEGTCMTGIGVRLGIKDQRREGEKRLPLRGTEFWRVSRDGVAKAMPWGAGIQENSMERELQPFSGTKSCDRQAGWWHQLMQSSQVYIDSSTEGSKFVKYEKRKNIMKETREARVPEDPLVNCQSRGSFREGLVEGAEAIQKKELLKLRSNTDNRTRGRPSWMGSPPELVVNELKKNREKEPDGQGGETFVQEEVPHRMRWGRLFGATVDCPAKAQKNTKSGVARAQKNRLPSEWLSLDKSLLDFIVQTVGAGRKLHFQAPQKQIPLAIRQEGDDTPQPVPREGQAYCGYNDMMSSKLNFSRGDVLRVPGRVDPNWSNDSLASCTGSYPTIYVSLTHES